MLCRMLGRTRREMMLTMDAAELEEHWADYLREPFGPERGDIQTALIRSTIQAAAGSSSDPQKLMPFPHQREQVIESWQAAKSALGGGNG